TFVQLSSANLFASFRVFSGLILFFAIHAHAAPRVTLLRTPDGGIQPRAAIDSRGAVHLVYFKGDPKSGDLFYAHTKPGSDGFSEPVRVNSERGSAIATGTIRGAQIALGKNDRVHVAWNGSGSAPKGPGGNPM